MQWQVDAGKEVRVDRYAFTSANDMPARDPRAWRLEGSRDGASWFMLDEHRDEPVFADRLQQREYKVEKPSAGRFFRFTFTPNPGVEHFQVAEISIEGVTTKSTAQAKDYTNYRRELDLATAVARVDYERAGVRFERQHFVSAPDEVFVTRLTANKPGSLSFTVGLDRPERFTTTAASPNELLMTGTLNDGRGGKGVTYATRLRVLAKGGSVKASGNQLVIDKASEVLLLLTAATDFRGFAGRQLRDRSRRRWQISTGQRGEVLPACSGPTSATINSGSTGPCWSCPRRRTANYPLTNV